MSTGTAISNLSFYFQPTYTYSTQSPRNIKTEMDGMALPFGYKRQEGEKLSSFALRFRRAMSMDHQPMDMGGIAYMLGVEINEDPYLFNIDCTDTSFVPYVYINSHKLTMNSITETSTTTTSFELLDSTQYPSLDYLADYITANVDGFVSYIYPYTNNNRNLLPKDLLDGQINTITRNEITRNATSWLLNHKPILPNSVDPNITITDWEAQTAVGNVDAQGEYYINPHTGRFYSYEPAPTDASVGYLQASTHITFTAVPSPVVNISNEDNLNTFLSFYSTDREIYYTASDAVATSTSITPSFTLNKEVIESIYSANKYTFDRWGE